MNRLKGVKTWMYQLENLEKKSHRELLASTEYDLLVIESVNSIKGDEKFNTKGMLKELRAGKSDRVVLAYLNIGQAESYRTYWGKGWREPTEEQHGKPEFIISVDPDNWEDNFPVAYWNEEWQKVILGSDDSLLDKIIADGFDGIYLDWVAGFEDESVVARAKSEGADPAAEMVDFIAKIREYGLSRNSEFHVVAQNAAKLGQLDARFYEVIDGLAVEDTWFRGDSSAKWGDVKGGDIVNTDGGDYGTKGLLGTYRAFLDRGIPVFSCDYCLDQSNADKVYSESRLAGLVPLVTQISLSKLTTTTPPWL